jgi:CheY-like chemotaxis protein
MVDQPGRKILIADDSPTFRELEGEFLARHGFELIYASDGAQAVKLAHQHRPDLILLDMQMPVMDGVQALATLKRTEATKDIPIVAVTTLSRDEDRRILKAGGIAAVLSKPIQGVKLLEIVRSLLGTT